jgi:uncharacterized protein
VNNLPVSRRPLLWWFGFFLLIVFIASQARFTNDLRTMLPTHDVKFTREMDFFTEQGAARIIALEAWPLNESVSDEVFHRALLDVVPIAEPLGARPLRSGSAEGIAKLANTAYAHLPDITPRARLDALIPQMETNALSERLSALKKRAEDPNDSFVATVARRDLLALSATPMQLLAFGPPGTRQEGLLTLHPHDRHAILTLEVDFDPATMSRTFPLMAALETHAAAMRERGVHVEIIGGYRHFRDNIATVRYDLFASIPLSSMIIALILWSLLRSIPATLALHVPALFGMLGAIGAVVLAGRELPVPMLGIAACVLGVAVDYATHRLVALRAREDVRRPLFYSYLTTAGAFAVLLWSDVPAMQCVGLLIVGGLTMSLLSTLYLLPYLVPASFIHASRRDPWEPLSRRVLAWCHNHTRMNLAAAALISFMLFPGLIQLSVVSDIRRLDGSRPGAWEALDQFMARWGKLESSDYLVQPGTTLDDALHKLGQSRERLGLAPGLMETLLPSIAEQRQRRQAWNDFWTVQGPIFAHNLQQACQLQKMRFAGFAPCLARYAPITVEPNNTTADNWLTMDSWEGTPVQQRLSSFIQQTKTGWRVASALPNNDDPLRHQLSINNPEIQRYIAEAEKLDTGAWVAVRSHIGTYLVSVVQHDLRISGMIIAVVLLIIVSLMMRSLIRIMAVLLPPTLALLWTFGFMGWCGIELTPFTALAAAFIGGIGIDSAIFLCQPGQRATALSPVMAATLTTVAGVSTLLMASHPMIYSIGQTLTLGMTASLLACLLITPSLVRR